MMDIVAICEGGLQSGVLAFIGLDPNPRERVSFEGSQMAGK